MYYYETMFNIQEAIFAITLYN